MKSSTGSTGIPSDYRKVSATFGTSLFISSLFDAFRLWCCGGCYGHHLDLSTGAERVVVGSRFIGRAKWLGKPYPQRRSVSNGCNGALNKSIRSVANGWFGGKPTIFGFSPHRTPPVGTILGWAMAISFRRTCCGRRWPSAPWIIPCSMKSPHGENATVSVWYTGFNQPNFQTNIFSIWTSYKKNWIIWYLYDVRIISCRHISQQDVSQNVIFILQKIQLFFWGGTLGILNRFLNSKASSSQTDHMVPRHDLLMGSYAALLLHRCSGRHCEKWRCTIRWMDFPPRKNYGPGT